MRQAPHILGFVAIISVIVTGIIVFTYQEQHYAERFATFEERDKYLSGQLDDYKRAFPGKSPDEAAKEVAALRSALDETRVHLSSLESAVSLAERKNQEKITSIQAQISKEQKRPFRPWTLDTDQRTKLGKELEDNKMKKYPIQIQCLMGSTQSQSFATDLISLFRQHEWEVIPNCFINNLRPDIIGVYLALPTSAGENFGTMPEHAPELFNMLRLAKIDIKVGFNETDSGFVLVIGNPPD
jgi:hypothetical protein